MKALKFREKVVGISDRHRISACLKYDNRSIKQANVGVISTHLRIYSYSFDSFWCNIYWTSFGDKTSSRLLLTCNNLWQCRIFVLFATLCWSNFACIVHDKCEKVWDIFIVYVGVTRICTNNNALVPVLVFNLSCKYVRKCLKRAVQFPRAEHMF